ncbi:MAG: hypothetical protein ABEJ35_05345 [Halobacteriaceae archaeon]
MPFKQTGAATDPREIDRFESGVGWIAHPDEEMQRASHALAVDGDVYLIDPLRIPDLDSMIAEFGELAGVVVLLGRHGRDAVELAAEYEVPLHLPGHVDIDIDRSVAIERHDRELADTGYEIIRVVNWPGWREAALFDGETLVVPEAVGNADFFTADDEALGVSPVLRLTPPSALRGLAPDRVLVGHGPGVLTDGAGALRTALRTSRRKAPRAWLDIITPG